MSWKDKLVKALFEEESSASNLVEKGEVIPEKQQQQQTVVVQPSLSPSEEIDKSLLDKIEAKIKAADIPGPDYLELKEAAEGASDEPDESKRWKQAFRNMKVFFPNASISKEKIIQAIDHYISIVKGEEGIGLKELEQLRNKNVEGEIDAVSNLDKEIQALEIQINEKKKERDAKNSKILTERSRLDNQEKVFKRTIDTVLRMIEQDKTKINNWL